LPVVKAFGKLIEVSESHAVLNIFPNILSP